VRAWRLLKKQTQVPHRDWQNRKFVAVWHDGEILREVEAETIRESWTQYDPELVEREFLPKDKRRDLHKMVLQAKSK
jgi:7,8-dihydro-6-hydroxymethylpterin-pyrophosphokinase